MQGIHKRDFKGRIVYEGLRHVGVKLWFLNVSTLMPLNDYCLSSARKLLCLCLIQRKVNFEHDRLKCIHKQFML